MDMQSLTSQLMDTGLFARVDCLGAAGGPARAFLNAAGHEMLARLGKDAFDDGIARTIRSDSRSPATWQLAEITTTVWPCGALSHQRVIPRVLSHLHEESVHRLLLDIDPSLSWFDGHFPGRPILAGVAQLHLSVLFAQSLFALESFPRRINRLKFQNLVVPPCVLELRLETVASAEIRFRLHAGGRDHSQGRLCFAGEQP